MSRIILPKTHVPMEEDERLYFLAGPIRGADNWHYDAMDILQQLDPNSYIASPRRTLREDLEKFRVYGGENFSRQRAWEKHYLEYASQHGSILFWLPGETEHNCEKAFGAITRFEMGQWLERYRQDNSTKWVFGSNGEFPELSTIQYDMTLDAPDLKLCSTLQETCEAAVANAHRT